MVFYLSLPQEILSALNVASSNATSDATANFATVTDFSSLMTMLSSLSALPDWLKLIVFGGMMETLRRLAFSMYYKMVASFWITAHFDENDDSYDWMMAWLSKQKQSSWTRAREVEISTRSFDASAITVPGEEEDSIQSMRASRKLAYLPSASTTYSMWYHRRYMTISRVQTQTGWRNTKEETLQISILTWSHHVLNELLLEAKKNYMAAKEQSISIYVSDIHNDWRHVASRPKRALSSIILDPGMSELLVDDARDFLASKEWYAARGIPFRRGYLLYGAPGSGKTSIISSIAGELGLDVYIVSLSRAGMDDSALSELVSNLPEKCIALMEDIDAALSQNLNRDAGATSASAADGKPPPPALPTSRLSLSGLLNALDGVAAQEGRILYATTNKYMALDPALVRPGRMDLRIEFFLASKYQARKLFYSFYLPSDNFLTADDEKDDIDSGYSSSSSTDADAECTPSEPDTTTPALQRPVFFGTSHRQRAPKLRWRQVEKLAERFAEAIPERELSMATLQGYLMTYKTRPFHAVDAAKEWVEREREPWLKKEQQQQGKTGATATDEVATLVKDEVKSSNSQSEDSDS